METDRSELIKGSITWDLNGGISDEYSDHTQGDEYMTIFQNNAK